MEKILACRCIEKLQKLLYVGFYQIRQQPHPAEQTVIFFSDIPFQVLNSTDILPQEPFIWWIFQNKSYNSKVFVWIQKRTSQS